MLWGKQPLNHADQVVNYNGPSTSMSWKLLETVSSHLKASLVSFEAILLKQSSTVDVSTIIMEKDVFEMVL